MMTTNRRGTVVNVFTDHDEARSAVSELRDKGFSAEEVGVVGRLDDKATTASSGESYAAEGAATGLAAGAGAGALWGLGIIAGVMPILGPAIAGGTLAAILTSAAAGAAAAGVTGTLVGLGIPRDEADYYESEVRGGRFLVTVSAVGREAEASEIMHRHGGYTQLTNVS